MKKKLAVSAIVVIALIALYCVGTGFMTREDVMLFDYSVTQDGTAITLKAQTATSMGYVRGYKDGGGGVKPHYLTFYSTFGGMNSALGATDTFVLEVEPNDTEIYFNRSDNGFELVLMKNETTGEWSRPGK